MIKEKYKWYISITTLILAVIMTFSLMNFSKTNNTTMESKKTLDAVLNKDSVMQVSIDIDDSDWQWLIDNATNEEYKSCNITIDGNTYYNVGIRPKGNTSLTNVASDDTTDRYSFKIKFDEYVEGQTYNGMKSIVLNNIIQDNTYMKEYITYDLYNSLGVAVPEMAYTNIKVNNENWGLYLAIEVIDQRYLENNFGTTEGNLYKPETMGVGGGNKGGMGNPPNGGGPGMDENRQKPQDMNQEPNNQGGAAPGENTGDEGRGPGNRENGEGKQGGGNPMGNRNVEGADFKYIDDNVSSYSIVRDSAVLKRTTDTDFEKVINMLKNLNDGTNLEEVLDVKEVLKYFAVNAYVVNLDSYSGAMYHNYYLYEKDGRCQILPWDLNLSFGGFSARGGGSSSGSASAINFPIDNPVSGNLEDMPLIGKLLEVDEYKELYHNYLQEIADNYFNSGYYADLVNKLDNLISDYVQEDTTAFCTYEEYKASIPEMITFGEDRTKSVLAQLNGEQPSTTYGDIESTINMSALGNMGGGNKGGGPGEKNNKNNNQVSLSEQTDDKINEASESKPEEIDNNASENNNQNSQNGAPSGPPGMQNQNSTQNNTEYYVIMGVICLVGLGGLLAVFKFKRKGNIR